MPLGLGPANFSVLTDSSCVVKLSLGTCWASLSGASSHGDSSGVVTVIVYGALLGAANMVGQQMTGTELFCQFGKIRVCCLDGAI